MGTIESGLLPLPLPYSRRGHEIPDRNVVMGGSLPSHLPRLGIYRVVVALRINREFRSNIPEVIIERGAGLGW